VASQYLAQVAKGFFLPRHMDGGLVYKLIANSVPGDVFCSIFGLCAFEAEAERISRCFITLM
jgi:hypothetical protein